MKEVYLKDILETFDRSKIQDIEHNLWYDLLEKLELPFFTGDNDNERFRRYPISTWICTTDNVGTNLLLLDNIPVCITWQPYRKYDIKYFWLSKEKRQDVLNYLHLLYAQTIELKEEIFDENNSLTDFLREAEEIDYKRNYIHLPVFNS